jgi:hypothetical protein
MKAHWMSSTAQWKSQKKESVRKKDRKREIPNLNSREKPDFKR